MFLKTITDTQKSIPSSRVRRTGD